MDNLSLSLTWLLFELTILGNLPVTIFLFLLLIKYANLPFIRSGKSTDWWTVAYLFTFAFLNGAEKVELYASCYSDWRALLLA